MQHPIDSIQWIESELLDANDYNPNIVARDEFRLLKHSLLTTGWLQPVLVSRTHMSDCATRNEPAYPNKLCDCQPRYMIIDGFHRSTLAREDKDIITAFGTRVPCAVLNLDEAARKLLTVRINRAKGSHVATKMHELITSLHVEHGLSVSQLMTDLGAPKAEIELLLQENIFKKMEIDTFPYSRAWVPQSKGGKRASV